MLYGNEPLVEVISAVNEEAIFIDTVDLYKEPFYIKQDTEYAVILEDFNKALEYFKNVKLKGVNKSIYIDELGNALAKHTRKENGKIVLDVTSDTLYEIAVSLVRVAKDDEKLAVAIYNDMYRIKDNIEKNKERFESEEFEELFEELFGALDELPSREDFVEDFKHGIDEMYKELKSEREYYKEYDSDFNMEIAFDISMLNKIKTIEFNADVESVRGTVLLDTGRTFKAKNYKMDSYINLEKVMDTDEAEEIGMEVVKSLSNKVLNNDKLIKYLESSEISDQLEYYFGTSDIRDINTLPISIIDNDNSKLSKSFSNIMKEKSNANIISDENEGISQLASGEIDLLLIINEGYENQISASEISNLFNVYSGYNPECTKLILEVISEEVLRDWVGYKIELFNKGENLEIIWDNLEYDYNFIEIKEIIILYLQ